jgi:hypothetical protein
MQFDGRASFVQTVVQSGDRISNTSSTTTFATKYTIPESDIVPGVAIFISASGEYGTANIPTNRAFDSLQVSIGGNIMLGVGSKTPNGINVGGATWTFESKLICVLDGVSGLVEGSALWTFADSTLGGSNDQVWANATNGPFALNTTVANDVELAVRYFTADPSNYIQMRHLIIYAGA